MDCPVSRAAFVLALSVLLGMSSLPGASARADSLPDKLMVAYTESYDDVTTRSPQRTQLAHVPPGVNVLNISFLNPDYSESKNADLGGLP